MLIEVVMNTKKKRFKRNPALQELDFFSFSQFLKKVLIVNSIAISRFWTRYFGYASILGFPLCINMFFLVKKTSKPEDYLYIIGIGIVIFYLGMEYFLKYLRRYTQKKYSALYNEYTKEIYRKVIRYAFFYYVGMYYIINLLFFITIYYS